MASKGDIAKDRIIEKIKNCFGDDYIDYVNKRIYVWGYDGGEKIQIALSMTCPKNWIAAGDRTPDETKTANEDWDWSNPGPTTAEPKKKAEVTDEEKARIEELMKKFNLI